MANTDVDCSGSEAEWAARGAYTLGICKSSAATGRSPSDITADLLAGTAGTGGARAAQPAALRTVLLGAAVGAGLGTIAALALGARRSRMLASAGLGAGVGGLGAAVLGADPGTEAVIPTSNRDQKLGYLP